MTLATADMGVKIGAVCLHTIRANLHLLFKEWKTPLELRLEDHIAAGICEQNLRDRAGKTQVRFPGQGWQCFC